MTTAIEACAFYRLNFTTSFDRDANTDFEMKLILPFYEKKKKIRLDTRIKLISSGLKCIWNRMASANICNTRINQNEQNRSHENAP